MQLSGRYYRVKYSETQWMEKKKRLQTLRSGHSIREPLLKAGLLTARLWPWLLRKPLSFVYKVAYKLVQIVTGIELRAHAATAAEPVVFSPLGTFPALRLHLSAGAIRLRVRADTPNQVMVENE